MGFRTININNHKGDLYAQHSQLIEKNSPNTTSLLSKFTASTNLPHTNHHMDSGPSAMKHGLL